MMQNKRRYIAFGELIWKCRRQKKISMQRLAQGISKYPRFVHAIESGTELCSLDMLGDLIRVLGLNRGQVIQLFNALSDDCGYGPNLDVGKLFTVQRHFQCMFSTWAIEAIIEKCCDTPSSP